MNRDELRAARAPCRRRLTIGSCAVLALALAPWPASAAAGRAAPGARPAIRASAALKAEIRSSFYVAYRADRDPRRDFGAAAGLSESAVIGPVISRAGVVPAARAAADSTWVIAAICIGSPLNCQDAGAFQVFERTGAAGPFTFDGFAPCLVPGVLAQAWFPGGHYPMGATCPAGSAPVRRGGLRAGGWSALVPRSWRQVPCSRAGRGSLDRRLCSSEGGDTDVDIWYDPAAVGERLVVVTCRRAGCAAPAPVATGNELLSRTELRFHLSAGAAFPQRAQDGPDAIDGLYVDSERRGRPSFPTYVVTTSLPGSESGLATAILTSFAPG